MDAAVSHGGRPFWCLFKYPPNLTSPSSFPAKVLKEKDSPIYETDSSSNCLESSLKWNATALVSDGYQEPRLCFDSSFLGQISALDGIREIKRSAGGYLALDSGDTVWQPLLEGSRMGEGMQDNEQDRPEKKNQSKAAAPDTHLIKRGHLPH